MNGESLKKLRIFAASPGDMSAERAKVETVAMLLKPLADNLGIVIEVLDWRAVVPEAGRAEQVILDQLKPTSWDVFVGILWHRFGTPTGAKDVETRKDYLSGTEEEFYTAYRLWQKHKKPRIMMYRCTRPFPFDVDPDQLKRVNKFFKLIENPKSEYRVLAQKFDTTESFEKLLLDHLQKLLLEYGELIHGKPVPPETVQAFAPKIPNNLPRPAAFFGRAKEMDLVMRALSPADRTWGVLVDGIGGIGKTALALEAAHRCKDLEVFDAFIFVSAKLNRLDPSGIKPEVPVATTLDEFVNETARVLGRQEIPKLEGEGKRRALLNALRETHTLLVYDNLETLTKEDQEALADWLRFLPQGCKAIITSRRRGGEGAVWLRVEKLDWDGAFHIIENEIGRDAELANKLRRVQSRWQELYDETNGSPLALVHTLGLMRVRAALTFDGALAMLRGAGRNDDLVNFVYQEARKELTTNDKAALGALSFFVPSATFEAWMRVAGLSRNALETTIDRLSALSLVDMLAGEERYSLHPLTRNFVRDELLADANVARKTGIRFAQYWVDYAGHYGGYGKESYKTYDQLEAEWMNLDAAASWLWEIARVKSDAVGDKDAARMLNDLASTLNQFLLFAGRWDAHMQFNAQAYEAMLALNDWSSAGWRAHDVAYVQYSRARTDDAVLWADRCADVWARSGGRYEQGAVKQLRGFIAIQRDDYDMAERFYQEALTIARDLNSDVEVIVELNDLGGLECERKDYDAAEQYFREALQLAEKNNLKESQAFIFGNLGELAFNRKRVAEARKWLEQELALVKEVGRQELIAHAQYGLARMNEAEGRTDLALPLAQDALKIYERLQHKDLAEVREFCQRIQNG